MIDRTIGKLVEKAVHERPVVLITGARQVGKSTLCGILKDKLGFDYVSLDDLRFRRQAQADPELFLELHGWPLIIDEIQYAPALFDVIESIVNRRKFETGHNEGMYILTGSSNFELMKGVTQSLAGRVAVIRMLPLSMREILGLSERPFSFELSEAIARSHDFKLESAGLYETIVRGMYPELYEKPQLATDSFYSDYVTTYLERDVSQLINLKDRLKFQEFLEVVSSLTGQELVYEKLARAIGVKSDTIKSWISVLEASGIVYLLEPYLETSVVKRVVHRPKLYFNDTGLAAYLAGLDNAAVLSRSIFKGRFVETYMVNEIRKSFLNNGLHPGLYYYRDRNQNEIDLVVLMGGVIHLLEFKSGIFFKEDDVSSFNCLSGSAYQIGTSFLISNTPEPYPLRKDVHCLPLSAI